MTRFLLFVVVAFGTLSMSSWQATMAVNADQEVVIVHFGDSTCITGYLPNDQRVEAVLNHRLSDFCKHQKIVGYNVAAGGDYIRRFLDNGRYEKVVKDKIPQIDIALIRYGHNDQKHCEPIEFRRHLEEFCDLLRKDYPGIHIILETNTWVDPEHHGEDPKATVQFNERMNSVWAVVRQVAKERKYPLVEIYERKKKETEVGNWDQRIRNQQLSGETFATRILDGSRDEEMKNVPGWFVDNHPNANGVNIIADEEFKTITRLWPKGLPSAASEMRQRGASATSQSIPRQPTDQDERYHRLIVGTWEDDYQGKRTMTLKEDGTATMVVELQGAKATLFASRLRFDMKWSVDNGRLKKRTIGGEPSLKVRLILNTMGDRVDEPILELNKDRLLLMDGDGKTKYDWRRVP
jgi:lysophospholipase L1-like esterase